MRDKEHGGTSEEVDLLLLPSGSPISLSCRGRLELEPEGMRQSLGSLLGGEEWVTLAGCLRRVSVICWYRRLWSGLTWGGRKGLRIETMVKLLLTFPQGHQDLKGQNRVFNNSPYLELEDQTARNGGCETSTGLLLLSSRYALSENSGRLGKGGQRPGERHQAPPSLCLFSGWWRLW